MMIRIEESPLTLRDTTVNKEFQVRSTSNIILYIYEYMEHQELLITVDLLFIILESRTSSRSIILTQ